LDVVVRCLHRYLKSPGDLFGLPAAGEETYDLHFALGQPGWPI
jgi:hypothetical protein